MYWKLVIGTVLAALVVAGGAALLSSFREHTALLEFKHALRELQQKVNGFAIAELGEQTTQELNVPGSVEEITFEGKAIRVAYRDGPVELHGVTLDLEGPRLVPGRYVLRLAKTGSSAVTIGILG